MLKYGPCDVLVTGGTGFVGSHLVESLIKKGRSVRCLVRDPARLRRLNGLDVQIVQGDCSLPETLDQAVKDVSTVIHTAGLTKARFAREYYKVNRIGTRNVLEACGRHDSQIRKFILVSSLAAAGSSPDGRPVKVTDEPRPVSDYGKSKLLAEHEALDYKDRFNVVILRPSAVYGPRDRDMFELFRWASRGFMPEISGGDRFIAPVYVEDLASALVLALDKDTLSGSIYFVSGSRPYSWAEFRERLLSAGGVHARKVTIPYWAAYIIGLGSEIWGLITGRAALTNRQKIREAARKYWICDMSRTENELGFKPEFTLEKGLEVTWKWYKENGWL